MTKSEEIFNYCLEKYNNVFTATRDKLTDEALKSSKKHILNNQKTEEIEKAAQKEAIKQSIIDGRLVFPDYIAVLWSYIYKAHLYRKSGITDPIVVHNAISAEQSWRASSGHAFEEMIKELGTSALNGTGIKFILQKDLNILIKANELANEPRDIAWLEKKIKGDTFDLYVISIKEGKTYCVGCCQCKTSIRDRVTRDREPSIEAMKSFFWSIAFVLDGTMLNVPKYIDMVNGNPNSDFVINGWHGLYDLSSTTNNDRIYALDINFEILRNHTIKAVEYWHTQRQWFNVEWKAK